MIPAARPANEEARLKVLSSMEILDTPAEEEFDGIVKLAAHICGAPIALVSLIDERRQWFKARVGLDATETPREVAYCAHAILETETMVVRDASKDPRFVDNPLRVGPPHVQFYAGVPLRTSSGHSVGTLCVIDRVPRDLTPAQKVALESLAAQVVRLLDLRRATILQHKVIETLQENELALRRGMSDVPPAERRGWSLTALVLASVLAVSAMFAAAWVKHSIEQATHAQLLHAASRAERFLEQRTRAYGEVARGTAALFHASERVTPDEFRRYVETLDLSRNYPGLLGVGYAEVVQREELAQWQAEVVAEQPGLQVAAGGQNSELVINRMIEPLAANRPALGFDLRSDPARSRALDAAAASGELTLSEPVTLRQFPKGHSGLVFYLPLKDKQRRVRAFVYAVTRVDDLFHGFEFAAGSNVDLELIDQSRGALLFGSALPASRERVALSVRLASRNLEVRAAARAGFDNRPESALPWLILFVGLALSGLSFALTTSMRRTESRSRSMAKAMTHALRQRERELQAIIDGTTDLILNFTHDGHITLTNRAFRTTVGVTEERAATLHLSDFLTDEDRQLVEKAVTNASGPLASRYLQVRFRTHTGLLIEVEGALSTFHDGDKTTTRAIFRDVTARKQAERALVATNEALEKLARTDVLTGVANRRAFEEHLEAEVSRARRSGAPLSLVLLDVDHFKLYNDLYGHLGGDDCLRQVGGVLAMFARRTGELAARYGGEEFALILPSQKAQTLETAERLRNAIAELGVTHARNPAGVVTVSMGLATFDARTHADAKAFIEDADRALYAAKAGGRNRVAS